MIESPMYPVINEERRTYLLKFLTSENKMEKSRIVIIDDVFEEGKGFKVVIRYIDFNLG